ncbi:hypothetical protein [Streptomyces lavendulae]|uniref:hypothetical protein n=1 Tax=Streptomyces lavendulae TaxID=1914 RepID=UPI0024A3904F|nr:hypothetical protein [Streptomyces lavendulae]GLX19801.1 hypothetical protein Slala01_34450 [Streptomyces lavendulae subsp. lavendulae]GLX27297.1 hypothetical protein Slala02_31170 [Streptomyces lavendulae subsp. lavendulae]
MPARIRADLRNDVAEGVFPVPHDPDRLFAVGGTDNGERIFWITDPVDEPDRWHIAVNEARGPRWFAFGGSLTEFLGSVFTGRTSVPQFPRGLLDEAPGFTRSRPVLWKPVLLAESAAPVDTASIRAWARANGYECPPEDASPPRSAGPGSKPFPDRARPA